MKILAGTLINETLTVRLLKRGETLGPFADLNELRHHLADLPFIPAGDWSDFGRGSRAVRYLMLGAMLTAGDSGGTLPENTAVIGWNGDGCTAENLHFWQDYVRNGRVNGRGSLFVATLPTIPYCEAAITLGCRGGTAYFQTERSTAALFRLLVNRTDGQCLIGEVTENSVCMFLLETGGVLPELPDAESLKQLFFLLKNPS